MWADGILIPNLHKALLVGLNKKTKIEKLRRLVDEEYYKSNSLLRSVVLPSKNTMHLTSQLARRFRAIHTGSNWTNTNIQNALADVSLQQAITKMYSFNTIAALTFHMNYYVSAVLKVLQGGTLDAHDKYSFDCPELLSQDQWDNLKQKTLADAENLAVLVEQLPENKIWETFTDEKYGTYYSNITGLIEHNHYHLGQIVLIKKWLMQ